MKRDWILKRQCFHLRSTGESTAQGGNWPAAYRDFKGVCEEGSPISIIHISPCVGIAGAENVLHRTAQAYKQIVGLLLHRADICDVVGLKAQDVLSNTVCPISDR